MSVILLIIGLVLLLWGIMEALWTTIWVDGNSAPFTSRLTTVTWRSMRLVINSSKNRSLSLAGPLILAITVCFWVFSIWMGWVLIFYSQPESLLVKETNGSPDLSDVWWYVGYTMFTVGNGDFIPQGGLWQVLSSLVAFTGMGMVTLSVTYVLQVISAVTNKRAFASEVTSIGKTAEQFVIKQWTGENFGAMKLQLNSLSGQLARLNEQHMAFPILHYYHAARPEKSQDMAIAILDDALSIIKFGMHDKHLPPETILSSTRQSVDSFLTTVKQAFISSAQTSPPMPDLRMIREAGVPVVSDEEFQSNLDKEQQRRKLLLGLINTGAWHWPGQKA